MHSFDRRSFVWVLLHPRRDYVHKLWMRISKKIFCLSHNYLCFKDKNVFQRWLSIFFRVITKTNICSWLFFLLLFATLFHHYIAMKRKWIGLLSGKNATKDGVHIRVNLKFSQFHNLMTKLTFFDVIESIVGCTHTEVFLQYELQVKRKQVDSKRNVLFK